MDASDAPMIATPDPELQHDLVRESVPDPLAGEQTWPTEEVSTPFAATVVVRQHISRRVVLLLALLLIRSRVAPMVVGRMQVASACKARAGGEGWWQRHLSMHLWHAVCCRAGQLRSCS